MLVIYHSYGGTGALVAAALHLQRVSGAAPRMTPALLPSPVGSGGGPGLHLQGRDADGHAVFALARNVPPGVIDRAFLGVASVFKLPATAFLLVDAGQPGEKSAFWLAWGLVRLGRPGWARRLLARCIHWTAAAKTVAHTRQRLVALAGVQQ